MFAAWFQLFVHELELRRVHDLPEDTNSDVSNSRSTAAPDRQWTYCLEVGAREVVALWRCSDLGQVRECLGIERHVFAHGLENVRALVFSREAYGSNRQCRKRETRFTTEKHQRTNAPQ